MLTDGGTARGSRTTRLPQKVRGSTPATWLASTSVPITVKKFETLLQALIRKRHLSRPQTVQALDRRARALGVEDFALSVRQLDRWLAGGLVTLPRPSVCKVVEAEFGWPIEQLLAPHHGEPVLEQQHGSGTGTQVSHDELRTEEFVAWLAAHSNAEFSSLWTAVAEEAGRLTALPRLERAAVQNRRSNVTRAAIADALRSWYGDPSGLYQARVGSQELSLSVMSRTEWIGVSIPLGGESEEVACALSSAGAPDIRGPGLDAAVRRLAAVEASDTVMVNDLVYQLRSVAIADDRLTATFDVVDFAAYALTTDLLEEELLDSVVTGKPDMPLRGLHLPSVQRALDLDRRHCVGGPACLTAIARPEGDYALLVQQRSSRVLNVAGRLAVIPKAFHQPMVDSASEARVSTTIEREFEEELLGRLDLDVLGPASGRRAAPLHHLVRSEPAAWFHTHPGGWRLDCTGFGINLASGNYEFACLLTIEDQTWWERYGHLIEANWEAQRLRCWSSRDRDGLEHLVADSRWSNEGLFAFIEGLRLLQSRGDDRVSIPQIEVGLS